MKRAALILALWGTMLGIAHATTFTVSSTNNSGTGSLRQAILSANADATATALSPHQINFTVPNGSTITVISPFLVITNHVHLNGLGVANLTISGGGTSRIFWIQNGTITIQNLTLANGYAKGGDGSGGGMGAGGAIFMHEGKEGGTGSINLSLINVNLSNNRAVGGNNTSSDEIGGGGMGGNGGAYTIMIAGFTFYQSGGGGVVRNGDGGGGSVTNSVGTVAGTNGGISIFGNGGNYGTVAGNGGFGGGGGGGTTAGNGGFGGGGGSGTGGGHGGFGGGGGGGTTAGNGGFGGGGGKGNFISAGGFGGGNTGGGGMGAGGAIFVASGSLSLTNVNFTNNNATRGTGDNNGKGYGGALFVFNKADNGGNVAPGTTNDPSVTMCNATFSGNTADDDNSTYTNNDNVYASNTSSLSPNGYISSNASTICAGGSIQLTFTSAGTGPFDIVVNGVTYNDVPSGSVFLTRTEGVHFTGTTNFSLTQITDANNCVISGLAQTIPINVNTVSAGSISANHIVCAGGDPNNLTSMTDGSGAGTVTYRWESSTTNCSSGFNPIMDATGVTYNPPAGLSQTTYFRRVTISTLNGVACEAASNCVTITINNVSGGTVAGTQVACYGGDPTMLSSTGAGSGSGTITYRWERGITDCNTGFTPIMGATGVDYDPPVGITQTTFFRRVTISTLNGFPCEAIAPNCIVIVVLNPQGGTIAGDETICSGGDPAAFTSGVEGSSNTGTITYRWEISTTNCSSGFNTIMGATGTTYDPPAGISQTTYFRRVTIATFNGVASGACEAVSNCVTVTVQDNESPTIVCPTGSTTTSFGQSEGNTNVVSISTFQSFTPVSSGAITSITIYLNSASSNLTLQVQSGNTCDGTILGSKTFNGVVGFQTITFDTPIPVTGGVQYNFGIVGTISFAAHTNGSYSGGRAYLGGCSGAEMIFQNYDLVFTITMSVPGPVTLNNDPGTCTATYVIVDPISDNCTGATWGASFSGNANGNPANFSNIADGSNSSSLTFQKGTTHVVLTGTDAEGNPATCSFDVVVTLNTPEVQIRGNGMDIADGDNMPDIADHTDFGSTTSAPITRTFTIHNTGTEVLNLAVGAITISGPDMALFSVSNIALPAAISAPSGSITFDVTYTPVNVDIHTATVNIASNDCDVALYNFDIKGEKNCPVFTAAPGNVSITNSTCISGCVLGGGTINAPLGSLCPVGSTLQYKVDNGPWTNILPTYNQTTAQTIKTRCSCDANTSIWSDSSAVTTVPGTIANPVIPANGASNVACLALAIAPALPVVTGCDGSTLTPSGPSIVDDPSSLTCEGTRTYTYTYSCGTGSSTWSYVYTIEREPFTVPSDGASTVACLALATAPTLPTVTSNCGETLTPAQPVSIDNPSSLTCEGTRTYAYTYTDCEGNTATWSYVYTIERLPFTVPSDGASTVACLALATAPTLPTVTSNCGETLTPAQPVITDNPSSLTCEGTRTYAYTYTDCEGNTATWSYVYTIERLPFTVPSDGASTVTCLALATAPTLPTVTSNCGETLTPAQPVITDNPSSLTCEGTRTYAYTYTDCEGNTATWSYVYTIERLPFTVPSDGASTVACLALATAPSLPTVMSNCGETLTPAQPVITDNPSSLTCEGTRTYAYVYTDCEGNTATWSYVYTIERLPFTVPSDGASTVACLANATPPTLPTVTSNCGETLTPAQPVITDNPSSLTCEGTRTYAYVYTDCEGNTATWSYVYTIEREPFTVPSDGASTVACLALATAPSLPTVTSNCGETLTPAQPLITDNPSSLICEGTRTYAYTYTDCEGNTATWSYVYTIEWEPFTVPADGAANVTCLSEATQPTPPTVTSNCGETLIPTGPVVTTNPSQLVADGTKTYTWTYTDCEGNTQNWKFVYTIKDNTPPSITCPQDIEVCEGTIVTFTAPIGTDNCAGATTEQISGLGSGVAYPVGTTVNQFKVTAANGASTTCSFSVTVNPLPQASISGTTSICQNGTTTHVTFSASGGTAPYTFTYTINNGNSLVVSTTGSNTTAIVSIPSHTIGVFNYTLISVQDASATTCSRSISTNNVATVTVENCDVTIKDPCTCVNNAPTIPNGTLSNAGTFVETITVNAPTGQTWKVSTVSGLYLDAAATQAIASEALMTETSPGKYTLQGYHIDAIGYSILVSNGLGITLNVSNKCFCPDPVFSGLPALVAPSAAPFQVTGTVADNVAGTGTFLLDGVPQPVPGPAPTVVTINPATLSVGTHTLEYSFDAGAAASKDSLDPGCVQVVRQRFQVAHCGCQDVTVSLDANCQFVLTGNLVSDANCGGGTVRVMDNNPSNGNIIDCAGVWTYGLFDAFGNIICWGKVTAEDKRAPELVCAPADITLDCYDVSYVLNNPLTIGNRDTTNSPRPAATGNQTINNAEGVAKGSQKGDNCTNTLAPPNLLADNIKNLGYAYFRDNCRDCGCRITLKWTDKVVYYSCTDIEFTRDGYYAKIEREWVATDCNGMSSSDKQDIYFKRPSIKSFTFANTTRTGVTTKTGVVAGAPNYDWVVEYNSCTPDKSLIAKGDVTPRHCSWFNTASNPRCLYIDQVECNYSVTIKDTEFPICNGKGVKIDREMFVFDWCKGGIVDTIHILIKIGDFEAPKLEYAHHAPFDISTGPMDCTAAIPTTAAGIKAQFGVTIKDNCTLGNISVSVKTKDRYVKGILIAENVWEKVDYAVMNGMMIGLPVGTHRLIIDASDGCYNAKRDSFNFEVKDKIAPVMKCDDDLHVTLSNANGYTNGYAQVSAADIDEGSWDNCKLAWIAVRRNVPTSCEASFVQKGYDSNGNNKLDAAPFDHPKDAPAGFDWSTVDGVDINGDGDISDFGEFVATKGGKKMTPLLDLVEFFCCDLSERVTVELWGADTADDPKTLADETNYNYCWMDLLIEDKVTPTCIAPWDVTIDCDDKNIALIDDKVASSKIWGDVTITTGNDCAALDTVYSVEKSLKCGYGKIVRKWTLSKQTAKGPITITCSQTIWIRPIHQYDICFPKDVSTDCKTPTADTVIVDELACDLLAVNVSDKRYDATEDECYKIFRTYTVINWCAYDDKCGDPMAEGNVFVVDRSLWGNNGKNPIYVLTRDRDRDLNEEFWLSKDLTVNNGDDIYVRGDGNYGGLTLGANVTVYDKRMPACDAYDLSTDHFQDWEYHHSFMYTQIIKVYDDVRPEVTGIRDTFCTSPTACTANITTVVTLKDNCSDKVSLETQYLMIAPFQATATGSMIPYSTPRWSTKDLGNGNFQISVSNLPEGTHDLIVVGRDECGNLSLATRIPFTVKDCKAPAPICINGLSTGIMPDGNGGGMMAVWASDFVASKIYDCNGQGPETKDGLKLVTKYSINRVGQPVNKDQTGLNFTCADIAVSPILVELHAWDEAGNHDFCITFVELIDSRGVCAGSATLNIAGTIATEGNAKLQGANITLSGAASQSATTTANGAYSFLNLAQGGDFTVSPQLDKNHLNGVSTFDLVLIQKHILGVQALNSPYKMIAADVNNSKSISTLDLIALRKLILNIDTHFANNTSWRFVDAAYQFPQATNPWSAAFPEVVSVNDLATNVTANFIAIKVGDVNASASVNNAASAEIRTNSNFELKTQEQNFKAGNEYKIAFTAADLQNIQGYQFALALDQNKVDLLDIEYGVAKAENFGIFKNEGLITTSWNSKYEPGTLFTLILRAKADTKLSQSLSLNRLVNPEAYDQNSEYLGIKLAFEGEQTSESYELKQNTPNPFGAETSIGFTLPKAAKATLTIRDVKGALIYKVEGSYAKGSNQIMLKKEQLGASGVLYYTLETSDFTATKKMIVLQ